MWLAVRHGQSAGGIRLVLPHGLEIAMKIYLGIDGGGTRTRMALADETGKLLSFAEGGSCSFTDRGLETARMELNRLWREVQRIAGGEARPVDALFMGMGSILSPADAQVNCDLAREIGMAMPDHIRAENDAWNAHAGGLAGRPGILLISGTGSACLGRNARGDMWRTGGWGHRLGETGSAHSLGHAAMIAATRAADGRGKATALTDLVCAALGLRDLKEIFRKVHHDGVPRALVAALAPQVVMLAETGDAVARQILLEAVVDLLEMVRTVGARLRMTESEIALTGGLINNAAGFRRSFLEGLALAMPGFRLAQDGMAPVFGAVLLAFTTGTDEMPSATFIQNLKSSSATFALKP
jgi:N-acetylglucosamine kinase-like BadF-type ATPase